MSAPLSEPERQDIEVKNRDTDAEIKVTETMTDAGLEAAQEFYCGDGGYALTDECLTKIFLKMLGARDIQL
jgi:hypothetical protein